MSNKKEPQEVACILGTLGGKYIDKRYLVVFDKEKREFTLPSTFFDDKLSAAIISKLLREQLTIETSYMTKINTSGFKKIKTTTQYVVINDFNGNVRLSENGKYSHQLFLSSTELRKLKPISENLKSFIDLMLIDETLATNVLTDKESAVNLFVKIILDEYVNPLYEHEDVKVYFRNLMCNGISIGHVTSHRHYNELHDMLWDANIAWYHNRNLLCICNDDIYVAVDKQEATSLKDYINPHNFEKKNNLVWTNFKNLIECN